MKLKLIGKWFVLLLTVSLIFASCKKQESTPADPENNGQAVENTDTGDTAETTTEEAETAANEAEETAETATETAAEEAEEAAETATENAEAAEEETASVPAGYVPLDLDLPRAVFEGTPQNLQTIPNLEPVNNKPYPPFYVPPGTTNLAAGKEVTASDDDLFWGEYSWITDGDKQATDGSYIELPDGLQWVQVDLGKEAEIYAVMVWHFHKQARVYYDVIVQLASDPDFTTDVKTIFNNDMDNSAGLGVGDDPHYVETFKGRLISAGGHKARYVRLYSNGNNGNEYNHYIEVEVFGK